MQILLVEPDPENCQLWKQRLQAHEVETICVSDPQSALAIHGASFIAVFFRWIGQPDDESERTLQRLQQLGRLAVCTVDAGDEASRQEAYAAGFSECLSIDCTDIQLKAKLEHATELSQLDARLSQAQKLESIGELAAGIAHEINTPIQYVGDNTRFVQDACNDLTVVLNACQDLIDSVDKKSDLADSITQLRSAMDDADVEYLIEEIPSAITQSLEGVDRVANIVRAMKEFAHPGVSAMTLTDLSKSIANTVMVARNEWKYVADLETEFDPSLPEVPCLPGEINQVLLNMIVNASHAIANALGESPETKGKITIATKRVEDQAHISISDTGCGIDQKNVSKIFDPFFTTKAAGKGTGQGLAIAYAAVTEKHGGSIHVESEVGQGTTFTIKLPLNQKRTDDAAEDARTELASV